MKGSRRLRVRLTVASFLLSALVMTGAIAGLVAVLHIEAGANVRARLHDRGAALVAAIDTSDNSVDISGSEDLLLDSPNYVFDASGKQIEGAKPSGALGAVVRGLGRTTVQRMALSGPIHLLAIPVRSKGRVVAVAVTGVDEAPYIATLASITRDASLLGLLAVLGATGLTALVLGRSLGPMATMTERAAEWSRHRSGSRFGLGPAHDELTGLAAVLDELLDRVEEALTAERRLTAEIAHELRSPLTLLIGEADLALMSRRTPESERPRYERIAEAARSMARAITALLDDAAADSEGVPDSLVLEAVSTVVATMHAPVRFDIAGDPVRARVRFVHLERMLAPLLENAATAAATTVEVRVRADGDEIVVSVSDDGGGIASSVLPNLFEPGVTTRSGGTGLGLALVRRLVDEAGGSIRVVRPVPAEFELRLPRVLVAEDLVADVALR